MIQKAQRNFVKQNFDWLKVSKFKIFSLPFKDSFHLSFTVLFAIGHKIVFKVWGNGTPIFKKNTNSYLLTNKQNN